MAFVGATFLHRELGHISPWISVGGYLAASYVGYSRIARNRHWTSDVLMGATVGMLMTNATYWAYDGIMSLLSKTDKSVSLAPYTDLENVGISFSVQF
jgi:membrane-associated phospholipid phosphatase